MVVNHQLTNDFCMAASSHRQKAMRACASNGNLYSFKRSNHNLEAARSLLRIRKSLRRNLLRRSHPSASAAATFRNRATIWADGKPTGSITGNRTQRMGSARAAVLDCTLPERSANSKTLTAQPTWLSRSTLGNTSGAECDRIVIGPNSVSLSAAMSPGKIGQL